MTNPTRKTRALYLRITIPVLAAMTIAMGIALPHIGPKPTYTSVDLHALGSFPMDQSSAKINSIPARWRALDAKKVCLMGRMYSPDSARSLITRFQFVYDISGNTHQPPRVQERVFATASTPVTYTDEPVDLYGTLHVNVKHDINGDVASVYEIDVDTVESAGTLGVQAPATLAVTTAPIIFQAGIAILVVDAFYELLLFIRRLPSGVMVRNICPVCGYDVRASPQRCPECGTPTGRMPVGAELNSPQFRKER